MKKITLILALALVSVSLPAAIISEGEVSTEKLISLISAYYPETEKADDGVILIDPEWTAITLYLDTDNRTIMLFCYWLLDENTSAEDAILAANEWNKGNMIPTAYYDDSDHSITADYAMTWAEDGIPSGMLMESVRWMDDATVLLGSFLSDNEII